MKTLKCLFPMLLMVSVLFVIEGCYTSFAVPNQGAYEEFADDTEVAYCDSAAGPGLVYTEERYADENCDPGVRIIIVQRPSWIVYDDPWDDWYYGYGWFDWYGGNWYSRWYDPWWTPCIFEPTPVVWHPWGWRDYYYRPHHWDHHWAWDPWPDYHHTPSHHYGAIHSRPDPERRSFDRRDRTVAARNADRHSENGARTQSASAKHRPATQGVSTPDARNTSRRRPEVIRDIRHDTPEARPADVERHPLSAPPKAEETRSVRSESRRNQVSNREDVRREMPVSIRPAPEKQEKRSPDRPVRSDRRVESSKPGRAANENRPAPVQSARASEKRSSEKSVQSVQRQNSSNRDSNGPVRRETISRPAASASHSARNTESGSSKRNESGTDRRSRR